MNGKLRNVVVTGCLAERQQGKLLEDRPEIDALVGVFGRNDIVSVVDDLYSGLEEQRTVFKPAAVNPLSDAMRSAVTPRHFAYLKISEGCDRLCTFCAIPNMRGKHFSKPIEQVVDEAKRLGDSGVREIVVVAQDTTYYGMDRYGKPRLNDLLMQLDQIESVDWIRLMYFYPMYIDDTLIDHDRFCQTNCPLHRHAAPARQRFDAETDGSQNNTQIANGDRSQAA